MKTEHPGKSRGLAVLLACFAFSVPAAFAGEVTLSLPPPRPVLEITSPADARRIPFELYFGLIVLKVSVNGSEPKDFLLDTGFPHDMLNADRLSSLGLDASDPERVDAPGGEIELASVENVTLGLPGIRIVEPQIATIPLSGVEPVPGRPIWGILGHPFFERFVVTIDYAGAWLAVQGPENFVEDGEPEVVPLVFEADQAFMTAWIEQPGRKPVPAQLKLDTGSIDVVGFNGSFVTAMDVMIPGQPRIPALGAAVGGYTENWVTRIGALRVGRYRLDRPVVGYSVDQTRVGDAGTIGAEFLRRFRVTLDYTGRRMLLVANKYLDEPVDHDMSGIFPVAEPPEFRRKLVQSVLPESPADTAGIRASDRILSINGRDAEEMSIAEMRNLLRSDGSEVILGILRGKDRFEVTLHLKRLI